jgi:hypothetical protein
MDKMLTEAQAAKMLIAKPGTLRKWRARSRGPVYTKLSGKVRYALADLEKFVLDSRVIPGEPKRRRKAARP